MIEIQEALGLSVNDFCDLLGTTPKRYDKIKNGVASHQALRLENFCDHLGITCENLIDGRVDLSALSKQFRSKNPPLPHIYLDDPIRLSKARSFLGIVSFVQEFYGKDFSRSILRRMQIASTIHIDPNEFVSLNLILDLLKELKREGFSDPELQGTGNMTFTINSPTELGHALSGAKSTKDLYRSVHEELLRYFDHIFDYKILNLKNDSCLTEIKPKAEFIHLMKSPVIGSREYCVFKQGVFSSLLAHREGRFAKTHEHECMYLGSNRCVYEVKW